MKRHEQAVTFLKALYDDYPAEAGLTVEFRPLPKPVRDPERIYANRWWPLPLTEEAIGEITEWAFTLSEKANIYPGVLPRWGERGDAPSVLFTRFLWGDIDGGDDGVDGARALLENAISRGLPYPRMAVNSGGGLHLYWELAELVGVPDDEARQDLREVNRRIVAFIGGKSPQAHADPASCDPPRILRLPGTWNRKQSEPRAVKLVHDDVYADVQTLGWWKAFLPALPLPAHAVRAAIHGSAPRDTPTPERLKAWAARGYPEGNRHKDLVGAAAWLVRDLHVQRDVAFDLLLQKAAASPGRRQITEREVERAIQWA